MRGFYMPSFQIKIEDVNMKGLLLTANKADSSLFSVAATLKLENNRIIESDSPEYYPVGMEFDLSGGFLPSTYERVKGLVGRFSDSYEKRYLFKHEKLSRVIYSKHKLKGGKWLVKIYDPSDELLNYGMKCLFSTEQVSYNLVF
jgi:hypothetical protein